jgi:hypothetical protein
MDYDENPADRIVTLDRPYDMIVFESARFVGQSQLASSEITRTTGNLDFTNCTVSVLVLTSVTCVLDCEMVSDTPRQKANIREALLTNPFVLRRETNTHS